MWQKYAEANGKRKYEVVSELVDLVVADAIIGLESSDYMIGFFYR